MMRPAYLALATALSLAAPTVAFAGDAKPVAAVVERTPAATPARATADDTAGYAQREQKDTKVADYQGGSFVVIGVSGGALIVALILILIFI